MESNGHGESVRAQLDEIQRGELAPWVTLPPTQAWWAIAFGGWAAGFTLVVGLLDGVVQSFAQLALVLVLFVLIAWDRRRRGTYPTGRPPRAFTGAVVRMLLGVAAVAGVAWLVGAQVSVWVAATIAGVGSWAVIARYEREYATIAARLREPLP
ncbi:MAG: hypothetical protein ACJ72B_01490 [Ornithinibacter sp.]